MAFFTSNTIHYPKTKERIVSEVKRTKRTFDRLRRKDNNGIVGKDREEEGKELHRNVHVSSRDA